MEEFYYQEGDFGVLGVLPSGSWLIFDSVDDYRIAYRAEEDDIIDGLAELEEQFVEYPEDWNVYA